MTLTKTHFHRTGRQVGLTLGALTLAATMAQADQVILDDLIVDGSACIGQDCVNGESFGFDTIRIKENNLRIKAQDTSSSASFPTNDWQLTFNESSNGGANKFSVDDIDGGRTPFTIEAGAPSHSLYVDDGGRIGFGTSTPVAELHVKDGDTPTLRLEQDGTSGFTPQTFDVAANETNFFIRDATNGSTLPFRIRPGAPSSSIDVAAGGNVGIGTSGPDADLHVIGKMLVDQADGGAAATSASIEVRRSDGTTRLRLEETSTTAAVREMLQMVNNGDVRMRLINSNSGISWRITHDAGTLRINRADEASASDGMTLNLGGDMTISGTLTQGSDRNAKMDIVPVDPGEILNKVASLPISAWTYKTNAETGTRHIGPMAQDFYALFGTGASETGISTMDTSGVALAAIKALEAQNAALLQRIEQLEQQIAQ